MITAYPARTDDPLVHLDAGGMLAELTPDEALDLADALTNAARLCETGVRDARLLLPPTRRRGRHVRPA